jgi:hypothetical protein
VIAPVYHKLKAYTTVILAPRTEEGKRIQKNPFVLGGIAEEAINGSKSLFPKVPFS